jgi:peptide/nickel transport system ATP-binding protein
VTEEGVTEPSDSAADDARNETQLLDVRGLTVRFPTADGVVQAVSDVSFTLSRGETLGVVGESGSGKSVSNLAIMGLLNQQRTVIEGHVDFLGRNLLGLPPEDLREVRGKDIAMVFQDPFACLHPMYRVGAQIAEAVTAHSDVSKKVAWARAVELLGHVGIPNAKSRARDYPHQFSGGMRQRAMIAMALVHNPSILICDEPTTALDVTVQAQILELIEAVKREFNIGVILVTHDLGVVAETANSVMVMYAGRIMEYGPAKQIFGQPQHPYAWGLLDSMPSVEVKLSALVPIEGSPPSLLAPPAGCPFHPRCRYRFEPCPTERPQLAAPTPDAHPDACHLSWEDKQREGGKRSIARLGDAA